MTEMKLLQISQ